MFTNRKPGYLLSVVIPVYNGHRFLAETVNSILRQKGGDNVEIVLCDDVSSDQSYEIGADLSLEHANIKAFKNTINLGMDRNFEQTAAHATGEYIWFCGQDDIIGDGAVEKVLSVIQHDSTIDFVFVNYSQYNHNMSQVIRERMLNIESDVICPDPQSFFAATGITLPTFLPAFIMRKQWWDRSDKKSFYGTQYVQIGVLLTALPDIKSYIIAYPYVKGRIPDDGWQQNKLKVLDIYTGYLEVITFHYRNTPDLISEEIYGKHFRFCWMNIYNHLFLLRVYRIAVNQKIMERCRRILSRKYLFYVNLMLKMPRSLLMLINPIFYRVLVGKHL